MRGAHSLRLAVTGCQLDAEGFQIARLDGLAAAESLDDALALLGGDVAILAGLGVEADAHLGISRSRISRVSRVLAPLAAWEAISIPSSISEKTARHLQNRF